MLGCVVGGRKLFREFLRSEYSEDNMLFWLACEDLKSETCSAMVEDKARLIYEDYISILSPKEVCYDVLYHTHANIDSPSRAYIIYIYIYIYICVDVYALCIYIIFM